eukprot:m.542930 g.542930  ORF g.542930 m.542930 type:complete len:180 (+) comp22122_c0_seq8:2138-2677(+)
MAEAEKQRQVEARKRHFLGGVFGRKKAAGGSGKATGGQLTPAEESSTHVDIAKAQKFTQGASGGDGGGMRARRERLQTASSGTSRAHSSTNPFSRTQSMTARRPSAAPDAAPKPATDQSTAAAKKQLFASIKEVGGGAAVLRRRAHDAHQPLSVPCRRSRRRRTCGCDRGQLAGRANGT